MARSFLSVPTTSTRGRECSRTRTARYACGPPSGWGGVLRVLKAAALPGRSMSKILVRVPGARTRPPFLEKVPGTVVENGRAERLF